MPGVSLLVHTALGDHMPIRDVAGPAGSVGHPGLGLGEQGLRGARVSVGHSHRVGGDV